MFLTLLIIAAILATEVQQCSTESLELRQLTSTPDMMILQCTVSKYNPQNPVHFHCDINGIEERCYEDCISFKHILVLKRCTKIINTTANSVSMIYEVEKSIMPSGSYHCRYKGLESHSITHTKEMKVNTTSAASATIGTTPKESIPQQPVKIRTEIVIMLLSVLTFSIILNLIFFIRCCVARYVIGNGATTAIAPTKNSIASCLCIDTNHKLPGNNRKQIDDIYDNIRDMHDDLETHKSKSSISHDSQNFLLSPTSSQITRSSTFPYKQNILVHTPTDQIALSALPVQPFMIPYIIEGGPCGPGSVLNHRFSSHGIYDDIAADSTMLVRQFASTGSLNHRPKRFVSSHSKASPLPEENPALGGLFTNRPHQNNDTNDLSSTYDINSSEEAYLSGKECDSYKDPVRAAKLEMSKEMMAKADTLLREAQNLLK